MNDSEFLKNKPEETGRKLFANKKANIIFGVLGAIIVVAIIGLAIWASIPVGA